MSGCGNSSGESLSSTTASTAVTTAPPPPTSTVPEGALYVAAPAGAFPNGVIAGFERASGCQVALQGWPAASEPSRLRRALGTIDLVAVRADAVRARASKGLLAPIDSGAVDGIGRVASRIRKLQAVALNGNTYAVPYAWEPLTLLSRNSAFPDGPPTSLRVLWEPARSGSVAIPDDPLTLATAALSVGVNDPFALDAADLSASDELLRLARVSHRWSSAASLEALFASGVVTVALGPPRVALALRGRAPVTATIPVEGAVSLVRTLAMPVRAPHPVCAYRFLSYMLQPPVQAAIGSASELTPVVSASCRALGSRRCTALHAGNQWGPRMQFARPPVAPAVPWSSWLADWRALP